MGFSDEDRILVEKLQTFSKLMEQKKLKKFLHKGWRRNWTSF